MSEFDLVTAADLQLMQDLAQRITAVRPDLVNSNATFGELAWIWGKGHACDGGTWPLRLWFSGSALVAWGWAYLPHQVRRSDGSVTDVTGAYLGYQVHPDHAALIDEVIGWYDAVAAGLDRTVTPQAADEFGLNRWAAHGYQTDPASVGDTGSWSQLNERDLIGVPDPVLPGGFRFRNAEEAGPEAAVQAHVDAWAPSTYTAEGYEGVRKTAYAGRAPHQARGLGTQPARGFPAMILNAPPKRRDAPAHRREAGSSAARMAQQSRQSPGL